jgi:hypothetical protein
MSLNKEKQTMRLTNYAFPFLSRIILVTAAAMTFTACDDNAGSVGGSITPDDDLATLYTDTFMLEAQTIRLDSVYVKSTTALLGELNDSKYGNLKSDYICQFYCQDGYTFTETPIDGIIDSAEIVVYYDRTWIGDSLAPMQATIYPVVKQLPPHYFTGIDPKEYADMQHPLGSAVYTPVNKTVTDSIWALSTSDEYYPASSIRIPVPLELGRKIYEETINNPSTFKNQQAFNAFFPGVYVTTTFGQGNMVLVRATALVLTYRYLGENSQGVKDSVLFGKELFSTASDVIQLNNFQNTDISHLLGPDDQYVYVKTPDGVFPRITLPLADIFKKAGNQNISNAYLSLSAMPQEEGDYALPFPNDLLLIPEDSVNAFFRESKIYNSVTSYSGTYSSTGGAPKYTFGNISALLSDYRKNYPEMQELNLLVVPIEPVYSTSVSSSYYYTSSQTLSGINFYLKPSALRLRKDGDSMQMTVVTSSYNADRL